MDRVRYMNSGEGDVWDDTGDRPPKHGDTWGRWRLNGEGGYWSLDIGSYYIRLDHILTNAAMNDWLFQLAGKSWVTPEDLGHLVLAFNEIFMPQANLCSMGTDKKLKPTYINMTLGMPKDTGVDSPSEEE